MTIIWCMVPEIGSVMNKVFCHSRPFFSLLPPLQPEKLKFGKTRKTHRWYYQFTYVYHKWQSYDVWLLRYGVWQTEFFVILDNFLPLYLPKNLKNQNFEKIKNRPGDIMILHKCTKNHNHMLHCSWDMTCDQCLIVTFHFGIFFTLLTQ